MNIHESYMHRCLALASLGAGHVAPNPMVGAVLVYEDKIIGEGYHARYGEPHAEVNCLASVRREDEHLVSKSTMYVSLEPCAHYGKTPPCADLIIRKNIPKIIIGCRDPFEEVHGKGIEKLRTAGVEVIMNVLEDECKKINKRFFTFYVKQRPYVFLKWAQSKNGKIAKSDYTRVFISNEITNRLVHKWRSEEASIMIGTNTALHDDPALNSRLWSGSNQIRLIVDMNLTLPQSLKIFDGQQPTIIFNLFKNEEKNNVKYIRLSGDEAFVTQIMKYCFELKIQSILVEGGRKLIQTFIDEKMWDEAMMIENALLMIDDGLPAPAFSNEQLMNTESMIADSILYFTNKHASAEADT